MPVVQRFVNKKGYGTVPKYLDRIKEDIEKNFNDVREMQMKEEEEMRKERLYLVLMHKIKLNFRYSLKNEEVAKIKAGLKQRWELLNIEYLKIAHIKKPDTQVMMKK